MQKLQIMPLNNMNIHTTCRTCLGKLEEYHTIIFEIPEFLKIFTECTTLSLKLGDGLPTGICEACFSKINDIYVFQQMCRKAVKQFIDHRNANSTKSTPAIKLENNVVTLDFTDISAQKIEAPSKKNLNESNARQNKPLPSDNELESVQSIIDLINDFENETTPSSPSPPPAAPVKVKTPVYYKNGIKLTPIRFKKKIPQVQGMQNRTPVPVPHNIQTQTNIQTRPQGTPQNSFQTGPQLRTIRRNPMLKRKVPKTHTCEECGKVFKNKSSLTNHRYTHPKYPKPYRCDQCGRTFINKCNYEDHINTHLGISNFICPHCGISKNTREQLRWHINSHTRERVWECDICKKVFFTHMGCKRHKEVLHFGIKRHTCSFCERMFASLSEKVNHERFHTGERPFVCHICNKGYTLNTHLKNHLKEHDLDYMCENCDARFNTEPKLIKHRKIEHEGKKQYPCRQCGKIFITRMGRDQHEKSHGEKLFECSVCLKRFFQAKMLEKHEEIHNFKKCDLCPLSYNSMHTLNIHKKVHHNIPAENANATATLEQILVEMD